MLSISLTVLDWTVHQINPHERKLVVNNMGFYMANGFVWLQSWVLVAFEEICDININILSINYSFQKVWAIYVNRWACVLKVLIIEV